jgi:hypothetical protein
MGRLEGESWLIIGSKTNYSSDCNSRSRVCEVRLARERNDYWYPADGPGKSSSRSHSSPLTGINACGAAYGLPEDEVLVPGLIPGTVRPRLE